MQPTSTPAPSSSVLKPSEATKVRAQVQTRSESSTHQYLTTEARVALTDQLWKLLWEVNDEHNDKKIKSQEYLRQVRSVLHRGADPNATDEAHHPKRNWIPLHEVCFSGNAPEVVDILLEFGANPNAIDNKRRTALHMCCVSDQVANSERIAKALITAGANPNAKDRYGSMPLHTMTYLDGSLNLLAVLVNSGADVNASDNEAQRTCAIGKTDCLRTKMSSCLLGRTGGKRSRKGQIWTFGTRGCPARFRIRNGWGRVGLSEPRNSRLPQAIWSSSVSRLIESNTL